MSGIRRNKSAYKSKATKSMNAFSAFDQLQIQEFKEAFNLIDQDKGKQVIRKHHFYD
jgi:Ca2+-binding EF-hand superfamily protein